MEDDDGGPRSKRRASLRLEEAAEKKVKAELGGPGGSSTGGGGGPGQGRGSTSTTSGSGFGPYFEGDPTESQQPSTSASSRFAPPSSSSFSSPTSSNGELDFGRPPSKGGGAGVGRRATTSAGPIRGGSSWQTDEPVVHPPPSFNLSTGQPLVNPPLKTQAAFVGKLYAMLADEEIAKTGLIHWSADGTIFTCPNPTEFSKIVLPRFFKHNNWQSFVRQLNMYSFNKVSRVASDGTAYRVFHDSDQGDMFAATSDPQAWEFRHQLFQRGKPHHLASIKRKSTRPSSTVESSLTSPTDEDLPRPVAGWMRDIPSAQHQGSSGGGGGGGGGGGSTRPSPPLPSSRERDTRPQVFGYNIQTGETIQARQPEEPRSFWDTSSRPSSNSQSQPTPRFAPPPPPLEPGPPAATSTQPPQSSSRFHADTSSRPPVLSASSRFAAGGGYPDSPYYPQPAQHSPMDALAQQVALLEDRTQRLTDVLTAERIEHTRTTLDLTSYLFQVTDWIHSSQRPSQAELRTLQDTLNRVSSDLKQKYETLMASDALASMATLGGSGGGGGGSSVFRDRQRQMDPPSSYPSSQQTPQPAPPPRLVPSLPDPRRSTLPSPVRSSPLTAYFPSTTDTSSSVRLGSSAETATTFATSPRLFPPLPRPTPPPSQRYEGGFNVPPPLPPPVPRGREAVGAEEEKARGGGERQRDQEMTERGRGEEMAGGTREGDAPKGLRSLLN